MHAQELEKTAVSCLKRILADPQAVPFPKVRDFFTSDSWESLFPMEQFRIFRMLLERVEYDGDSRALSLSLSLAGIRRFQEELAPAPERIPA